MGFKFFPGQILSLYWVKEKIVCRGIFEVFSLEQLVKVSFGYN